MTIDDDRRAAREVLPISYLRSIEALMLLRNFGSRADLPVFSTRNYAGLRRFGHRLPVLRGPRGAARTSSRRRATTLSKPSGAKTCALSRSSTLVHEEA